MNATVRAVERDAAEINVAPPELKLLTAIAAQFPGFAERVQRRAGAVPTMREIVESQKSRR